MQAIYVADGDTVDYQPTADVLAGSIIVLGALIGVASRPIPANTVAGLALDGVFAVARATGADVPRGTRHFWDAANQVAVTADGGGTHPYLGLSLVDAAAADPAVRIRINR